MPQVCPISPQRRMNRSCAVRSSCSAEMGALRVNSATAMSLLVSVTTETSWAVKDSKSNFRNDERNEQTSVSGLNPNAKAVGLKSHGLMSYTRFAPRLLFHEMISIEL